MKGVIVVRLPSFFLEFRMKILETTETNRNFLDIPVRQSNRRMGVPRSTLRLGGSSWSAFLPQVFLNVCRESRKLHK